MENLVHMVMENLGAFGIGLLIFLEGIFPPIPSELIMLLAGYPATRCDVNIVVVIAAGSIGSMLGILPWYYLGRRLGHDCERKLASRHGRWLTMPACDVDAAAERFKPHDAVSVHTVYSISRFDQFGYEVRCVMRNTNHATMFCGSKQSVGRLVSCCGLLNAFASVAIGDEDDC